MNTDVWLLSRLKKGDFSLGMGRVFWRVCLVAQIWANPPLQHDRAFLGGLFDLIFGSAIANPVGALSPTIFEENRQVKSTRPHPTISRRLTIANNLTVIGNFLAQGN
jgi:hypothetical protein